MADTAGAYPGYQPAYSLPGWTCAVCCQFVPDGFAHYCPGVVTAPEGLPVNQQIAPQPSLDRIAAALERIALALERRHG